MGYTPMIQQYLSIKEKYQDAIVFFRLGDFYEMFFEDAIEASQVLEIALTSRESGKARIPMCGIPHHAYEGYAAKLLAKGYKVAICEQTEEPGQSKGIVRREVIRVITPGTIMDEKVLTDKHNNFLAAVFVENSTWGLAYIDISTGEFKVTQSTREDITLLDELNRIQPAECLILGTQKEEALIKQLLVGFSEIISWLEEEIPSLSNIFEYIQREICKQNNINSQLYQWPLGTKAIYLILKFLEKTQQNKLSHLTKIETYQPHNFMVIDEATRKNLELSLSLQNQSVKGSLLGVLDRTITSMGARRLKFWLETPLLDLTMINQRLEAVEELANKTIIRKKLGAAIKGIYDLERLIGRISYGSANPRDLIALERSISRLPRIMAALTGVDAKRLQLYTEEIDLLDDIGQMLANSITDDPPVNLKEGGIFKDGFNEDVDQLRDASRNGKQWLAELETRERKNTGIKSLKVGYNRVFGYYLEVTKANLGLVPTYYHRKQTLVNSERFITEELKEKETLILGAEEKLRNLEYHLFQNLRMEIEKAAPRIQHTASIVAELDVLLSLAITAVKYNYCRPILENSKRLQLIGARHPIVEQLTEDRFVSNDYFINPPEQIINIITGPNMAGKSTYIRAAALIVIMAQIGSFVPADQAIIGLVDRVFARVGASDDLSTGQSTFMVEMNEVANILQNATTKSFIILDEVGRGTSTFDGISIAWAVSEYIVERLKARTLFATHYHELTELEEAWNAVANLSMAVREEGSEIIFLRKVVTGGADRSYGIHVAKLAGLPNSVIDSAYSILAELENHLETPPKEGDINRHHPTKAHAMDNELIMHREMIDRLLKIDMDKTSPIEAWHLLASTIEEIRMAKKEK